MLLLSGQNLVNPKKKRSTRKEIIFLMQVHARSFSLKLFWVRFIWEAANIFKLRKKGSNSVIIAVYAESSYF